MHLGKLPVNRLEPTESPRPLDRAQLHVGAFWITIFLIPTFFQRLSIGGDIVSYNDVAGVELAILGYIVHFVIVGRYLITPSSVPTAYFIFARFVPLLLISVLHVFALQLSGEKGAQSATFAIARQLLWVLCCLVMVRLTEPELLLTRLIQLTHFTFAIIILTYVCYSVTGVSVQLILRDGVPRAQGFLSEPSTVGCLLAGYSALALYERKWRRLLVAALISLLVNSVIAYAGFVIGLVSGAINLVVISSWLRRAYIAALLFLVPVALVVVPMYSHEISAAADSVGLALEGTSFSNTYLYSQLVLRILDAASLLEKGVELAKAGSNDVTGGLFRLVSVLLLLEQLQQSWHLYVGYGLGAHAQLLEATGQSLLDFGIVAFVISAFGLFGGLGLFGWLIWTVSRTAKPLAVYTVPFLAIISINPAGGIHMYSVVLLAAFLLSAGQKKRSANPLRLVKPRRIEGAQTSDRGPSNPVPHF